MMKQLFIATFLSITLVFYACTRNRVEGKKVIVTSQNKGVVAPHGPKVITRNIIQDRKGDIWMAAFDGVFKYDGKSFTNMTRKITTARFFSILEDRKGNFWFGSVGSGIYQYSGASFEIFTTKQGLLDNGAGSIYEDQNGHIWFGSSSGLSRYDGNSFQNYLLDGDSIYEATSKKMKIKKHLYGVTSIIQDKTGIFWFGAGGVFRYDGKSFIPFKHDHESFKNVRSIIEDRKGHIWIGGADGLWYYDGSTVTNLIQRFVGYIMEDKRGNIWISS